ncbi:hypothetical protein DEO72_LG3g2385 [Vigna unguiculata]|uniref:Uncharacterized protein n=1 Tax=Vigna unguiculata TaxID=3917 RepID=A0A4D6LHN2_VIGUN|nr:hypothetical protein DEO72_LG3g2385 [Vigna unguiculata]
MPRAGRYGAGGSHVLDYRRAGPESRTTRGEVRRGRATSGQVRVSVIFPSPRPVSYTHLDVYKRQYLARIPT